LSVYDATLGGALTSSQVANGGHAGLECPVPPEVFIEMNAELKTTPWHDFPALALDPMTDWVTQYASYVKSNYPQIKPIFEVINEPNNFITPVACFLSITSQKYASIDPAWNVGGIYCGAGGNVGAEVGKMASTAGQDLVSVYGAGNYYELMNMMPYLGDPSPGSNQDDLMVTSKLYVNQTLIPVQTGYTQTPAYEYLTNIDSNNYWNLGYASVADVGVGPRLRGIETALAYCYYNYTISTSCQGSYANAAAVMTQYFTSATGSSPVTGNVTGTLAALQPFITAAATCFVSGSRPANCTLNQTTPMMMYEGGFAPNGVPKAPAAGWNNNQAIFTNSNGDIVQPILSASNASQAVLSVSNNSPNGCVPGMTVNISSLAGGTWSGSASNYTVQSATATACTINLNSSSLGNFGAARTTASASWIVGAGTISVASCSGVSAGQSVYDLTAGNFIGYATGCSGTTLSLDNDIDTQFAANAGSSADTLVFSSAQITYTGSYNWITYLRNLSYAAPELDSATTALYNGLVGIGATAPSQYLMGSQALGFLSGSPWLVWAANIFGFYPVATCTSCTISSTTLTLGGTITGIFGVGQTILGGGTITGVATGAASNTTITSCTAVGSNVCGTTPGDTLGLSQASTVSSGLSMMGTLAPPTNNAGTGTTSPVRAWGAICRFNGNGSQCNGWLLKRDVDPASNDNDPMWLEKAA
jgi:hypothetical protein